MSTYHHPFFGFRLKLRTIQQHLEAEQYLCDPEILNVGPLIECGGNSDDLLFGFRPQESSIDPVSQATAIEKFTRADPRLNPEMQALVASVEPKFLAWLEAAAPTWANKRGLWEGPTLWLCPHA